MTAALAWIGVGAFGALGAWLRFAVGGALTARRPSEFPFGTFVVNLTGGFALGVVTGAGVSGDALLVFGTGLIGGYRSGRPRCWSASCRGSETSWPSPL